MWRWNSFLGEQRGRVKDWHEEMSLECATACDERGRCHQVKGITWLVFREVRLRMALFTSEEE